MNYKKVQVMATAHDLFITYDDLRFLDQSVVWDQTAKQCLSASTQQIQNICIIVMQCRANVEDAGPSLWNVLRLLWNLTNLEFLAQTEERVAEDEIWYYPVDTK